MSISLIILLLGLAAIFPCVFFEHKARYSLQNKVFNNGAYLIWGAFALILIIAGGAGLVVQVVYIIGYIKCG